MCMSRNGRGLQRVLVREKLDRKNRVLKMPFFDRPILPRQKRGPEQMFTDLNTSPSHVYATQRSRFATRSLFEKKSTMMMRGGRDYGEYRSDVDDPGTKLEPK